jgi:O-antigen biosynthesis protein
MQTTSIIIVTHKATDSLIRCVTSISHYTTDYELVVVANASPPETFAFLETADCMVLHNQTNEQYARACNKGVNYASSDFVCIMNDDCEATPNWLSNMLPVLKSDQKIGAVGPVSNNVSGIQNANTTPPNNYAPPIKTIRLVGHCILTRKDTYLDVGGLDPSFQGAYDDDDFCMKLYKAGYINRIAVNSLVLHSGSASWKDQPDFQEQIIRSRQLFFDKWAGSIKRTEWGYTILQ